MKFVSIALFTAIVSTATFAQAANPDHVRQLLQTGDCQGCDLSGVNLANLALPGANLTEADLSGAYLYKTNLAQANLAFADLSQALIIGTDFTGANLQSANLSQVLNTSHCSALEADDWRLENCIGVGFLSILGMELCEEAYNLYGGELDEVREDLCNPNAFSRLIANVLDDDLGNLNNVRLAGANLQSANMAQANLRGVDLRYANLQGANVDGAMFDYAFLIDAQLPDMEGADVSHAWLTRSDIGTWFQENINGNANDSGSGASPIE